MYEVPELQDYRQKWLEAERDLVVNWIVLQSYPCGYEPIDGGDKETSTEPPVDKETISQP